MEVCASLSCAWSWLGANASTVIALCALATALAAALYVARLSTRARKHDRLSSVRMLDIPFNDTVEATHPDRAQLQVPQRLAQGIGARVGYVSLYAEPRLCQKGVIARPRHGAMIDDRALTHAPRS